MAVEGISVTVTVKGGAEIARALNRIEKSVAGGLARGAVGEGANVIRDVARGTARGVGLGATGEIKTARGNVITLRGQIPGAIFSAVEKSRGAIKHAKVSVDVAKSEAGRPKSKKGSVPHWVFVEFGSINNAPRPFMRPALLEGGASAIAAIRDVLARGIARYNKPGG